MSYAKEFYPMGAITFAIACSHCKNIGSDKCHDCKCEKKSGFELNPESFKEGKSSEHS